MSKPVRAVRDDATAVSQASREQALSTRDRTERHAVTLAVGSRTVSHGLGRIPTGWRVIDIDAAATIYRSAWTDKTLTLVSDAAGGAVVEVF
jgi:hypothetical protein